MDTGLASHTPQGGAGLGRGYALTYHRSDPAFLLSFIIMLLLSFVVQVLAHNCATNFLQCTRAESSLISLTLH